MGFAQCSGVNETLSYRIGAYQIEQRHGTSFRRVQHLLQIHAWQFRNRCLPETAPPFTIGFVSGKPIRKNAHVGGSAGIGPISQADEPGMVKAAPNPHQAANLRPRQLRSKDDHNAGYLAQIVE